MLGVNLGKNKDTEDAGADYEKVKIPIFTVLLHMFVSRALVLFPPGSARAWTVCRLPRNQRLFTQHAWLTRLAGVQMSQTTHHHTTERNTTHYTPQHNRHVTVHTHYAKQGKQQLQNLLTRVMTERAKLKEHTPVLVKIAPDISDQDILDIAEVITTKTTTLLDFPIMLRTSSSSKRTKIDLVFLLLCVVC